MARTNEMITNGEGLVWHGWCAKHGVIADDRSNAEVVARYFQETWRQDVTEANLDVAFPRLKPHLKFKSAARAKFDQAAQGVSQQGHDELYAWFNQQRLVSEGDEGYENAENIISWMKAKNLDFSSKSFDLALSNIINKGHYGHAQLHWKPVEVKKQEREVSDAEIATWRSHAEGARVELPNGLVNQSKTSQVQEIVVNTAGKIDWKATGRDSVNATISMRMDFLVGTS